ncbi:MAG: PadR family transcriptional regulator [Euryarchaeota archaeon]|nr:PadR family transcriptional regulator [Euryarchaeota archaeon]MDE1837627.1 PadR family transcriptional regulator [Euryarchaeota archaeon]MDE1880819.1 PadR family transcriptional regulator [Euryarchaeota archaeon]MDE2045942.1 PadR family transcriptional regulator [Thermoplasmata archaeon]
MWHMRWAMHHKRGLRMFVLNILSSAPHNGVEIMDEIESATRGWWRPSPGSIYPVLEQLSQEGLVHKLNDGRYELTKKAREEVDVPFGPWARRPQSLEEIVQEIGSYVSYLEDLSRSSPAKLAPHRKVLRDYGERLSKISSP